MLASRLLCAALIGCLLVPSASAQPQTDTTVTWRSYSRVGTAQVAVYPGPPDEEETHTIVVKELARNRGPTVVEDFPYLADLVGRQLGINPTAAYWVLHWGGFSFEGADPDANKALFLRATFNRTESGSLSSPYWDVISATDVRTLTDRRWQR